MIRQTFKCRCEGKYRSCIYCGGGGEIVRETAWEREPRRAKPAPPPFYILKRTQKVERNGKLVWMPLRPGQWRPSSYGPGVQFFCGCGINGTRKAAMLDAQNRFRCSDGCLLQCDGYEDVAGAA